MYVPPLRARITARFRRRHNKESELHFARALNLPDVAANRLPSTDLARIVGHSTASEVAAIPLKPPTWIVGMNQPLVLQTGSDWLAWTLNKLSADQRRAHRVLNAPRMSGRFQREGGGPVSVAPLAAE
jgi:hypothetical protein